MYDRNGNFYRNTETDRNRNFLTETEITETETEPKLYDTNFRLDFRKHKENKSYTEYLYSKSACYKFTFKNSIIPAFSDKNLHFSWVPILPAFERASKKPHQKVR